MYFKPHAKCDSTNTNMTKILDGFIMDARYMFLVSMLKSILKSIMKRIAIKKT